MTWPGPVRTLRWRVVRLGHHRHQGFILSDDTLAISAGAQPTPSKHGLRPFAPRFHTCAWTKCRNESTSTIPRPKQRRVPKEPCGCCPRGAVRLAALKILIHEGPVAFSVVSTRSNNDTPATPMRHVHNEPAPFACGHDYGRRGSCLDLARLFEVHVYVRVGWGYIAGQPGGGHLLRTGCMTHH